MKLLIFFYHLLVANLFPGIILFLALNGLTRFVALLMLIAFWILCYVFIDKMILFFLGAREIIDSDNQELFQELKNQTYKAFETTPSVYLYSGNSLNCFILHSRKEWSVVLDRRLVSQMDSEQVGALVEFMVDFKKANLAWRFTKSVGLVISLISLIYWFWSRMFMLDQKGRPFKILAFFTLALFKPFFDAILLVGKGGASLECAQSLAPIVNMTRDLKPPFDYSQFLFDHIHDQKSGRELMIRYMESFPVLEGARVKRSF